MRPCRRAAPSPASNRGREIWHRLRSSPCGYPVILSFLHIGIERGKVKWLAALRLWHHARPAQRRSEEHTSELQSLMRISYAVFCLKTKNREASNDRQRI